MRKREPVRRGRKEPPRPFRPEHVFANHAFLRFGVRDKLPTGRSSHRPPPARRPSLPSLAITRAATGTQHSVHRTVPRIRSNHVITRFTASCRYRPRPRRHFRTLAAFAAPPPTCARSFLPYDVAFINACPPARPFRFGHARRGFASRP